MTGPRRALFIICRALTIILTITWLLNAGLLEAFSTQSPDPATSHVQAWNNHGKILYRTPLQGFILVWAWIGALILGLLGETIKDKNWWRRAAKSLNTRRGKKLFHSC